MFQEGATRTLDSSHLISSLFALLPIPVAVVDAQGEIVLANSTFNECFPNGTSVDQMPNHAVPVNGSNFDFDTLPLTDRGLSICVGRDTSSEERLRQQLVRMEKVGAIGRLATGVARELNDPLAGIVGYSQLLSREELEPSTNQTVSLDLPVATHIDDVRPQTEKPSNGKSLRGKSIMVIDDEVMITGLIDDYLGRFGADVAFLHSGTEAFEHLSTKSYDAVVCDQRMPGVNGQSLYRMVESDNPNLARRFIFVTGDALNSQSQQFFEQTGAAYLRKPFRLDDLLHSIEAVIGS